MTLLGHLVSGREAEGIPEPKKVTLSRDRRAAVGDLLKRDNAASHPRERRVAEITEFATGDSKRRLIRVRRLYYMAPVLELPRSNCLHRPAV